MYKTNANVLAFGEDLESFYISSKRKRESISIILTVITTLYTNH